MTNSGQPILSFEDADKLLGLSLRQRHAPSEVELAYQQEALRWSTALATALSPKMRRRAANALRLLQDARRIVLAGDTRKATSPKTHPVPSPVPQAGRPSRQNKAASNTSQQAGQNRKFVAVCKRIWNILLVIIAIIRAIFTAVVHVVKMFGAAWHQMEACGMPRIVVSLIFLMGLLYTLHGCNSVVALIK